MGFGVWGLGFGVGAHADVRRRNGQPGQLAEYIQYEDQLHEQGRCVMECVCKSVCKSACVRVCGLALQFASTRKIVTLYRLHSPVSKPSCKLAAAQRMTSPSRAQAGPVIGRPLRDAVQKCNNQQHSQSPSSLSQFFTGTSCTPPATAATST